MSDINVARTNMGRDVSNGILSGPKFVAGITYRLKNGLRRIFSKFITQKCIYGHGFAAWAPSGVQAALLVVAISLRAGHLTPDIGLLALGTRLQALHPLRYALQSIAFARRRRALAFVSAALSFVCHLLALICDSISIVSDAISLDSEPLALFDLSLAFDESILALIKRELPAFEFVSHVDMAFSDHD